MPQNEKVLVVDFGGQYNQLIARRVRECGVYCEVHPYTTPLSVLRAKNPIGIIFTALFMSMLDISGLQLTNLTAYNEYITNVIIAVIVYLSAFSLVIKMWIGKLGKKKDDGADANAEPAPAAASAPAGAQAETEKGGDAK